MSTILDLVQGSPEWLAYRLQTRNASETAAVLGVSPWLTAYQLWELRTGRRELRANAAMQRGTALEAPARRAYEARTGYVMEPIVMQDGDYSASLDGATLDGDLIVEIKCPMQGRASTLWQQVTAGTVPEHYQLQVQHQLMVSGAAFAHLFVFDGAEDGHLLEIAPDPATWERIRTAWDAFMPFIVSDSPPPLCDRDRARREDPAWLAATATYIASKARVDTADAELEAARQALIALADHPSVEGGGVVLTRFWRAGSVDYRKVPHLPGVDLEAYRGTSRLETRITVAKSAAA